MSRDSNFDEIERALDAPMISVKWDASTEEERRNATFCGFADHWRKMPDVVRARRSRNATDSELHASCEKVLYFLKYYAGESANPRFFAERETWSHNVLSDFAEYQRHRVGSVDTLAQAVLRDAMHELERTERRGL